MAHISLMVILWVLMWTIIFVGKLVFHITKGKVYEIENSKLYKAVKAKWDKI